MANEIKTSLRIEVRNPAEDGSGSPPVYQQQLQLDNLSTDQAAIGENSGVVTVAEAAESDMPIGDVSTLGLLVLRNLDDTNFVTWGPKSGGSMVPLGRLNPRGEPAYVRLEPGITITWQADTADCQVKMMLLED